MRIALAHPFVWPEVRRGAERYVDDLAWYLAGRGHHVELVTGTEGPSCTSVRADGVIVQRRHHVGMARLARFGIDRVQSFLATALPALRTGRYDIVHAMVPGASLAATLAGTPVVFTFIGHPTRDQLLSLGAGERWLYRRANRTASVTTALSTASARSVAALLSREPEVMAPGVRLDRFPLDGRARSGPPRLLFSAAPDDRRKNLDVLLRAMPSVLDVHPDARLLISGQGDPAWALDSVGAAERDRVRNAIDHLGVGSPEETAGRYSSATLTVLPAANEAFGLALVESLASGTPVVAAGDGGMSDIVDAEGVGRLVRSGAVAELAAALLEVVDVAARPETPSECARHARTWGWEESIGPRHEALYRRIAR
jgi:phosphatidylinositol alpha-mannosyltransferase